MRLNSFFSTLLSGVRNKQQISSCTMIDDQDFQVVVGGLISSSSSLYEVQDILGCGAYGEVTQCRKLATNETVAVKILKSKTCIEEAKEEVQHKLCCVSTLPL